MELKQRFLKLCSKTFKAFWPNVRFWNCNENGEEADHNDDNDDDHNDDDDVRFLSFHQEEAEKRLSSFLKKPSFIYCSAINNMILKTSKDGGLSVRSNK